ncbi:MAG: ABC transporter ATP-binding protein [Desulfobacula sp.]|jgi:lipoprotein-releasing system ATP-binding protein|uniref:ABC transporter ATP-binding protein n=1 Tax=Desulfobacula sp. TaxID=2593537 RepID=UPI001D3E6CCA|nr:ABC transporter ATP-binding protein [Desulfobacula sp.]MBT3484437.1 ABC transporter ATP-binding protein [Desulfobacula sp.]MBT3803352.1 ABC transporter ATP-binding protein [Desulfobacula sp.]MBT4023681.1 ABC transporter ATP-binding protein [Desulfobacula sp.]MBT4197923.1 ABC transporter ATP-binding protein [Desulfobacula sp.]
MDNSLIPLISLQSVSKCFFSRTSKIVILNNASFNIYQGETIAIVGPSGIGKSTLLNIVGTLDNPDSGKIFFKKKNLFLYGDEKIANFRNSKIGFVFQFHYLLQGFSALENVMMPGLIAHKNKKNIEKCAINMLERVGLSSRVFHRIEDLSGGEQQRTALARALVLEPDILLADEPTGNLDQENSKSVHALINELNKELGMTIVLVTHNDDLARMMERNVTILDGEIIPV